MIEQTQLQLMKQAGIRMLECNVCGCEIPNTRTHNAYYGYDELRHGEGGVCTDCLDQAIHLGTHPPHYVVSPSGPVRIGKSLALPFINEMWMIIRCE